MRFSEFARALEALENTSGRLEMYSHTGRAIREGRSRTSRGRRLPPGGSAASRLRGRRDRHRRADGARSRSPPPPSARVEDVSAASGRLGDLGFVAEELIPRDEERRSSPSRMSTMACSDRAHRRPGQHRGATETARRAARAGDPHRGPLHRAPHARAACASASPRRPSSRRSARREEDPKGRGAPSSAPITSAPTWGSCSLRYLREGLAALEKFKVRVGSPVRPMLAERLPIGREDHREDRACEVEAKLDGFRCQVHLKGGKVEIFSRNLERTTDMFPDIAAALREEFGARSAILDGEALAVNEETGEFHPFQVTVQRKRKHKVEEMAEELPLISSPSTCSTSTGRTSRTRPTTSRRARARDGGSKAAGASASRKGCWSRRPEQLQDFFDASLERGHEGVVAKRLDSGYEPGARNYNWIKLKRAYRSELNDTVDVVHRRLPARARLPRALRHRLAARRRLRRSDGHFQERRQDRQRAERRELVRDAGPARHSRKWITSPRASTRASSPTCGSSRSSSSPCWPTRSPARPSIRRRRTSRGGGWPCASPGVVGFVRDDKSPEDATTTKEIAGMFAQQRRSNRTG